MTVTGRLELVALDAADIAGLASFYAQLTGWQIVRNVDGWITLRAGDGQEVAFQQVAEHIPPQWPGQERPQRVHLDLVVDGHEEAALLQGLGGHRGPDPDPVRMISRLDDSPSASIVSS